MDVKKIGLGAAALALPLSALVPAAANATTVPGSASVVSESSVAASAQKPSVAVWDWQYNEDDDYFDIQVRYKCYKYHGSTKGKVQGWVWSDDYSSLYYGKARAKCDGKYHKYWIEADLYNGYDSLPDGDYTIYGSIQDPYGHYKYDTDTDTY